QRFAWFIRQAERRDQRPRHDPTDLAGAVLGEPDVPVRAERDALGVAAGGGDRELGHLAQPRDTADLVGRSLGEPQVPVRARRYPERSSGRGWCRVLVDRPGRSDTPYPRVDVRILREPESSIVSARDGDRSGARMK